MYLDVTILLLIPAVLLTLFAQWKVKSTFGYFARVPARVGLTGAEAAAAMARRERVPVTIRPSPGYLSDHYDPQSDSLGLSPEVYSGRSLASLGVAAHELGHALQKQKGYWPLVLRNGLVPIAGFSSQFSLILFAAGLFLGSPNLLNIGIVLFSAAVLFALITLPVEFDASARAMKLLTGHGLVTAQEVPAVRRVLQAAALTYVAAAVMAITQLLRMLLVARHRGD